MGNSNINNPFELKYTPLNPPSLVGIGMGAVGYVDTSVVGACGTDQRKLWVINATAGNHVGVRIPGEAIDPESVPCYVTYITKVSTIGHLEFKRNATADSYYSIQGYFNIG